MNTRGFLSPLPHTHANMHTHTHTHTHAHTHAHTHTHTYLFLKKGMKFSKNWVDGAIFKKSMRETERGGERKCKCGTEDRIFSFSFSYY